MLPNATINVSVSSHYREPSYGSEIVSQGILGEQVEVLEDTPLFSRIRQEDGYESWVSSDQVCPGIQTAEEWKWIRKHFVRLHAEPFAESPGIRDAVIGCCLPVIDEQGDWYRIALPDGLSGWAEKNAFDVLPQFSAENILSLASEFLGYQYSWGGRSPKGFDCSGFVQTVFRFHGILLPRDAYQQQEKYQVADSYMESRPADLLFFGKTPERVTHVAIALGKGRFIHASGWVKYNSCNEADEEFSRRHADTFISVNRYGL
jgi:hypothetical protein